MSSNADLGARGVNAMTPTEVRSSEDAARSLSGAAAGLDHNAARHRRAVELVASAHGQRAPLEARRAQYIRRLHRASDDFEATAELRDVEAALALIPR